LFNNLPLNVAYQYPRSVQVKACSVYLSGLKYLNKNGNIEYLIVASFGKSQQVLEFYKLRWQIETMFRAFKTAGFNLEDTHLKDYDRLDKLLAMVALAFVWAYKTGMYRDKAVKPIKIKKHGRPEKSLFAYGLEWVAQVLINQFNHLYQKIITPFLSCT
ncbi:MAG: transposase, partial [Bacteroidetes Order II. Incertae sedis bacterium]|nr:transposase [Bacteroidetes Order II. bacterium]